MSDTASDSGSPKKKNNTLLFVGIGCLVLLVVLGIAGSIIVKFFAQKVGVGMLQNAIEKKTGVKTNLQGLENGKMTFTDKKTGTTVDIGSGKLPSTFPSDFPVYPGAKVASVLSGTEKGENSGFWVTFSTPDSLDKVTQYYKANLVKNGWEITSQYSAGDTSTQTVTKGTLSGNVAISRGSDATETDIMVVLGNETPPAE